MTSSTYVQFETIFVIDNVFCLAMFLSVSFSFVRSGNVVQSKVRKC